MKIRPGRGYFQKRDTEKPLGEDGEWAEWEEDEETPLPSLRLLPFLLFLGLGFLRVPPCVSSENRASPRFRLQAAEGSDWRETA